MSFRPSIKAILLGSLATASFPAIAFAADEADGARLGDEIIVTGARLQAVQEVQAKRETVVISDSVSADEVGTLPDFGLGEALDRVPGISTMQNNARGESQFVSIRGLNADYNLVEIDGIVLPANEIGRRNVSLDVMPSSLAKRIDVYKSVVPAMNGNAIGGVTNLRTRSAFDSNGDLFIGGRADVGAWENKRSRHGRTPSGQAEAVISDTFGAAHDLGFVLSGSYYRRDSASLNSAIDSYNYYDPATGVRLNPVTQDVTDADPAPTRRRWLHYDNVRKRMGVFGKFEVKDGDVFHGALTAAYFQHTNEEERQSNIAIANGNPVASSITPTSGTQASGNAQVDLVEYFQRRTIWYAGANGEWSPSRKIRVNFAVNYAEATYHQDARLATYRIANTNQLAYTYHLTPGGFAYFDFANPSYAFDPGRYSQFEYGTTADDNKERALTAKADIGYNADADDLGLGVQAGVYSRFMKRGYDFTADNYRLATGTNFLLSDVHAGALFQPYNGGGQSMLFVDPRAAERDFENNRSRFTANSANAANSLGSDFTLSEDIYANYAMARFATDRLKLIGGVRYEKTDLKTGSNALRGGVYTFRQVRQSYDDWLPSAQLTFDVTPSLRVRAAYSKTIGRPNYDDLAERAAISVNNSTGAVSITSGNPGLKPRHSDNYDLSVEYYWGRSLFSVGLFRKDVSNDILTVANTADELFDGVVQPVTRVRPTNVNNLSVKGIELNAVVPELAFLPKPFDGLGFSANLTLLDPTPPTIAMANGSLRRLPYLFEASNTVANVKLFYTIGPITLQGAWNHRSPILFSVSTSDPLQDRIYESSDTFDAQLRIKLMDGITMVAQGKNLTNDRPRRMIGPDFGLLREELDNGRAYYLGAVFKL